MSDENEDLIYHTESDVVIGEIHPVWYSLTKGRVVWNGDRHTVLITSDKLVFLPQDKNGKLKHALGSATLTAAKLWAGVGPWPWRTTRAFLAAEGFDLFGERSISWRWFPVDASDKEFTRLEDDILYNALTRRSTPTENVNDFMSLPSAMLAMKFVSHQRAQNFFEIALKVRDEWEKKLGA